MCGAISRERGQVHYVFRRGAFDGPAFADFLKGVHKAMDGRAYFIVLDTASIPAAPEPQAVIKELDIKMVKTAPY